MALENNKTRVVLMGSLGVAVECLEWLLSLPTIEVIGVVCSRASKSTWRQVMQDTDMQDIAPLLGIPMLTLEDLLTMNADIGLSVRFHEILQTRHLERFELGVVNLHGAPLPEMRGSMCDTAAIIENRTEYGTSLHWMNTRVDAGDLLAVHRFPISDQDTVFDLFMKCSTYGLTLIKQHFMDIIEGKLVGQSQQAILELTGASSRTYVKQEVMKNKEITTEMSQKQLWNRVRAFQFPGHEPAYLNTPNGRITLNIQPQ